MGPSWCPSLRLLFLGSLLVILSAAALPSSPRTGSRPPELSANDALLARMCDPRSSHPVAGPPPPSWCHDLHLRRRHRGGRHRHHHRPAPLPLPPPGRGGEEEVDVRYGVAKRLVPTGPNPLHN